MLAINSGFYFTWVKRKDQNDKDGQGYNWVVEHMLGTRQALASTSRGKGTTHQNKQANQQKTQQKLFWKKKKENNCLEDIKEETNLSTQTLRILNQNLLKLIWDLIPSNLLGFMIQKRGKNIKLNP